MNWLIGSMPRHCGKCVQAYRRPYTPESHYELLWWNSCSFWFPLTVANFLASHFIYISKDCQLNHIYKSSVWYRCNLFWFFSSSLSSEICLIMYITLITANKTKERCSRNNTGSPQVQHVKKELSLNNLLYKSTPASNVVFSVDFFIFRQTHLEGVEHLL